MILIEFFKIIPLSMSLAPLSSLLTLSNQATAMLIVLC